METLQNEEDDRDENDAEGKGEEDGEPAPAGSHLLPWRLLSAFNRLPLARPGAEALERMVDLREEARRHEGESPPGAYHDPEDL